MFTLDAISDDGLIRSVLSVNNNHGLSCHILDTFSMLRGLPVIFDHFDRKEYRVYDDTICGYVDSITTDYLSVYANWFTMADALGKSVADAIHGRDSSISLASKSSLIPVGLCLLDFPKSLIHVHNIISFKLA